MTIVEAAPGITGGVDTHLDKHVAAALDPLGRLVGTESFPADAGGYKALLGWLEEFGQVTKVGVEGTSSYGTGLARFLRRHGVEVVEVDRQNRQARRNQGKSDPLDAIEAARAAISGRAVGAGKTKDGSIEAIRVLVVAKRSARQARVKAITQMRHLGFTAPDQLHSRLEGPECVGAGGRERSVSAHPIDRSGHGSHQGIALLTGSSHQVPGCRNRRAGREDRAAHCRRCAGPIGSVRRRSGHRSILVDRRRRQSREAPLRGRLGSSVWRGPRAGRFGEDLRTSPPSSGWQPPSQSARCGALSWSGSPTTPRQPTISSAELRKDDPNGTSSGS